MKIQAIFFQFAFSFEFCCLCFRSGGKTHELSWKLVCFFKWYWLV